MHNKICVLDEKLTNDSFFLKKVAKNVEDLASAQTKLKEEVKNSL